MICDNMLNVFDYLESNVLPVAERHFRFALGDAIYDERGTNNISEGQNSRFDRFVGLSTSVDSILALVRLIIAYLRSAGNTFIVAKATSKEKDKLPRFPGHAGDTGGARSNVSVKMSGWKLGAALRDMRRGPKQPVAPGADEDFAEALAALASSDDSDESDE
jgi:hypothetical protein